MDIDKMVALAIERSASDLHLNVGSEPVIRIDGKLKKFDGYPPISEDEAMQILEHIANREQRERFLKQKELDFSYELPELGRHRVNALVQKGSLGKRWTEDLILKESMIFFWPVFHIKIFL